MNNIPSTRVAGALAVLLLCAGCQNSAHQAPYPRWYLAEIREHGGCGLWLHQRTPDGLIVKVPAQS